MSENMLSQDEIDALLKGTKDLELDEAFETPLVEDYLSPMEQDALGEIGNISFGSSATALSALLNQKVDITTPTVSVLYQENVKDEFPHPYVAVQVKYTVGFQGANILVIKQNDAAVIADLMLGGDGTNPPEMLDEIQLSAVQEAMNQMMGSAATSMSTVFGKMVDISPPAISFLYLKENKGAGGLPDDDILVKISFTLKIGTLIDSNIMQLLPVRFAKELVSNLLNVTQSNGEVYTEENVLTSHQESAAAIANDVANKDTKQEMGNRHHSGESVESHRNTQNHPSSVPQHLGFGVHPAEKANIQPVDFTSFESNQLAETESQNLNMLLDIPLQVTVELGRTKRSVKEILSLSSGSIIELDKLAGEPVDILVNNKLIAKGEVVVIDENFGVRVTDILSQSDRIKKLR